MAPLVGGTVDDQGAGIQVGDPIFNDASAGVDCCRGVKVVAVGGVRHIDDQKDVLRLRCSQVTLYSRLGDENVRYRLTESSLMAIRSDRSVVTRSIPNTVIKMLMV